mmetsp:Transcript_44680/g.69880  ORF Transcript_44680/g.69880 Transcript_44680/m.69880 type:complete len:547 (+) Transcript_44680:44-1684(+)
MELFNKPWIIHWQRGLECGMKRKKSSEERIRSTFADGNAHTAKVKIPGLPYEVLKNMVVEVMEELGLKVQGNGGGASQVNFPTMLKFEQFAQKLGLNTRFCTFEVEGDGQKKKIWSLVGCYCNLVISFEDDEKFKEDYKDVFADKGWTPFFYTATAGKSAIMLRKESVLIGDCTNDFYELLEPVHNAEQEVTADPFFGASTHDDENSGIPWPTVRARRGWVPALLLDLHNANLCPVVKWSLEKGSRSLWGVSFSFPVFQVVGGGHRYGVHVAMNGAGAGGVAGEEQEGGDIMMEEGDGGEGGGPLVVVPHGFERDPEAVEGSSAAPPRMHGRHILYRYAQGWAVGLLSKMTQAQKNEYTVKGSNFRKEGYMLLDGDRHAMIVVLEVELCVQPGTPMHEAEQGSWCLLRQKSVQAPLHYKVLTKDGLDWHAFALRQYENNNRFVLMCWNDGFGGWGFKEGFLVMPADEPAVVDVGNTQHWVLWANEVDNVKTSRKRKAGKGSNNDEVELELVDLSQQAYGTNVPPENPGINNNRKGQVWCLCEEARC